MTKRALILILILFYFKSFSQKVTFYNKDNSSIGENDLWSIAVDSKGNKWIGTHKLGLCKFNNDKFSFLNKTNSPIQGEFVTEIYIDKADNVWLEFSQPGRGLAKWNGTKWTIFDSKDSKLLNHSVIVITENEKGNLLLGTSDGVVIFDGKTWSKLQLPKMDLDSVTVRALDIDSKGRIAIGHNEGLLLFDGLQWNVYDKTNSELQLSVVRAVRFLKTGELCIGYGGGFGAGGFSVLNNNQWKHYNKNNSKLPDQTVSDIELMENGIAWMATNDGAVIFDGKEIIPIKFREGKYKNVIMGIARENEKVMWLVTTFGLIKYEYE